MPGRSEVHHGAAAPTPLPPCCDVPALDILVCVSAFLSLSEPHTDGTRNACRAGLRLCGHAWLPPRVRCSTHAPRDPTPAPEATPSDTWAALRGAALLVSAELAMAQWPVGWGPGRLDGLGWEARPAPRGHHPPARGHTLRHAVTTLRHAVTTPWHAVLARAPRWWAARSVRGWEHTWPLETPAWC